MSNKEMLKAIRKSSYPFLSAPKNFWINANNELIDMEEMDLNYLKSCQNYLKNHKTDIFRGSIGFHDKKNITDFDDIKELLKELYVNKLEELDLNIENRA
ncbi:hypothetical protein EWH84_11555 [Enterococcus faecium]|uniref:hypothetical protein n=1 Tax=Enterococcus faecium TaxID=1352 RepID=UPI00101F4248|nr:hypothetical protein [Enterococcus faecium]RYJ90623.1 hypothetical protein EWH84_11555 [Enterococcus faecium]